MNEYKDFDLCIENFKKNFENINIKNFNTSILKKIKIKIDKKIFLLEEISLIEHNDKKINIIFKNLELLKNLIKKNFFENYGFQVLKKKNSLELIVPVLSLEFRQSIIKLIKKEYLNTKELIEFKRKKFLDLLKNKYNKDDFYRNEKKFNKYIIKIKELLLKSFLKISENILND